MTIGNQCRFGILVGALLLGCSKVPPPPPQRAVVQGVVDKSLPPAQQEKQGALKGVLDNLQQGMPYSKLKDFKPNVQLTETAKEFYQDVVGLERWEFGGKPEGNDVPVVLYMSEDKPDNPERRVERIYTVTGSGGNYVIARKK